MAGPKKKKIIVVNPDVLFSLSNKYTNIENDTNKCNVSSLNTGSLVEKHLSKHKTTLETGIANLKDCIETLKTSLVSIASEISSVSTEMSFGEIAGNLFEKTRVASGPYAGLYSAVPFLIDKYGFEYDEKGNIIIKVKDGENEYTYIANPLDQTKNKLEYKYELDGEEKTGEIYVQYYLPEDTIGLGFKRTYTLLECEANTSSPNSDFTSLDSTDGLLIVPTVGAPEDRNYSALAARETASLANKDADGIGKVIGATMFGNTFAGTNSPKQNVILGGSRSGGSAVKIAANSNGLYGEVDAMNYCPLLPDINNGGKGKTTIINTVPTDNEWRNLAEHGVKVNFINSSSDANNGRNNKAIRAICERVEDCAAPGFELNFYDGSKGGSDKVAGAFKDGTLENDFSFVSYHGQDDFLKIFDGKNMNGGHSSYKYMRQSIISGTLI